MWNPIQSVITTINNNYCSYSSNSKESACNAGDPHSIPGPRRSSEEENGNPLQYSCLENPTAREAWWAIVRGITESDTAE